MPTTRSFPPVVLLHGCGGSPEQAFIEPGWAAAFAAAGREALMPRLPGHGRGSPSHDPADYADLAGALLPCLPHGTFDLVGFSLGAKLALDIAVRFPGRIRRMVLGGIGDNAFAPETIGDAAAAALEHGPTESTPPPVRAFLDTWDPQLNDPLAIAAVLRRPANPVFTEAQIAAIAVPVAVVNGRADFVASMGTRLIDALGVEQVLLPGVGHFDLTARPEFRGIALDFLGQKDL
ncbi:MAG: alpha/beta fold hydrolase [Candidatus Andeanibacterium colombiense]|uniref:Alpha/beta fold hydrolase n=1 Tax=Candidatus Andeanibacterium colombiense TaxID=3121345 RepID=A0AAJ5X5F1_9SPHN|nr:MAG: alpha/beta fold hydrolase [Sphingomonadaceae bacterium]